MIDPSHDLPIARRAKTLKISRSSVYYRPHPNSPEDLYLMEASDHLHLDAPFVGSRMLKKLLATEGIHVGRRHVQTLIRKMVIEALYRKCSTSRRHLGHQVFPYLLPGRVITTANEAWALDIMYTPMAPGLVYFDADMDRATRKILPWRLSNTLTADFCVYGPEDAMQHFGCTEIVNTDQGSQFTSADFVARVHRHGIALSIDSKGAWKDNIFIERF